MLENIMQECKQFTSQLDRPRHNGQDLSDVYMLFEKDMLSRYNISLRTLRHYITQAREQDINKIAERGYN